MKNLLTALPSAAAVAAISLGWQTGGMIAEHDNAQASAQANAAAAGRTCLVNRHQAWMDDADFIPPARNNPVGEIWLIEEVTGYKTYFATGGAPEFFIGPMSRVVIDHTVIYPPKPPKMTYAEHKAKWSPWEKLKREGWGR